MFISTAFRSTRTDGGDGNNQESSAIIPVASGAGKWGSGNGQGNEKGDVVEDQADVDARHVAEVKAKRARELALRSQVIQRKFPRPQDINMTVLRPNSKMQGLNDLQKAEELVKQEMITMLHYDALHLIQSPHSIPV